MQEIMKIISVVGARPNLMKIGPFAKAIQKHNKEGKSPFIEHRIIHTGQHYDARMTDVFFQALDIPQPDVNLQIGSGSHAEQVGYTMIAFEKVLLKEKPDWVVVPGDVNATLACALAAAKLQIKVCHIEAGLRSQDYTMPEEINRVLTDRISTLLLTTDEIATDNLVREGIPKENIQFTGNIMIDTLKNNYDISIKLNIENIIQDNSLKENKTNLDQFILMTMHRPSNVDDKQALSSIVEWIVGKVSLREMVIWVIHPRTENQLKKMGLWEDVFGHENIILLHPLNYHELLKLSDSSKLIITDSGGLQEEATVLGKPCIVLRNNTERPLTLVENGGACLLCGNNIHKLNSALEFFYTNEINRSIPEKWDGNTAERCLDAIVTHENFKVYA